MSLECFSIALKNDTWLASSHILYNPLIPRARVEHAFPQKRNVFNSVPAESPSNLRILGPFPL